MARKHKQKSLNLQALSAQFERLARDGHPKFRKLCASLQASTDAAIEVGVQADSKFLHQSLAETIIALLVTAADGDARLAFDKVFESLEE